MTISLVILVSKIYEYNSFFPKINTESSQQKQPPYKVSTKEEVIEVIRNNLDKFAEFGVMEVGLFGSFVRSEATPESDVDLLVNLKCPDEEFYSDNYFKLLDLTDNLFENRKVDLMTENTINEINGIYICREVEYVTEV
ncbi:MAG: hypothetical protein RLZZ535_833 [Cyanobacteriota bacterium]|jgi:predicted nucleotidyltransferase